MPSLKAIRRRIGSVKNTQKITKAMKMVASARLRRAKQRNLELRPYADKTLDVLSAVAARAGEEASSHPLLVKRPEKRVMLVVLTSDRGLAGAFNASINRATFKFWRELEAEGAEVTFSVIGRKGRDFLRRRDAKFRKEFMGVFENLNSAKAGEIARYIVSEYTEDNLDACYIVYNKFVSAVTQKVTFEQLLPIKPSEMSEGDAGLDFIYEPTKRGLLDRLLPMYAEVVVYRALLESVASEHAARSNAMDSATRNASEMIGKLTLQYNRARQAAITKELMEIIGGSEALKG